MLKYLNALLLLAAVHVYSAELADPVGNTSIIDIRTYFPRVRPRPESLRLTLCTFSEVDYRKCQNTVDVALKSDIPLRLNCLRRNQREECIGFVRQQLADMVVLGEHDYDRARQNGLRPVVFARQRFDNVYVAVAPQDITLADFYSAPIDVDVSNDRAFHAATLFNLLRGHNLCPVLRPAQEALVIKIVNSAAYTPAANEILLCPNKTIAQFTDFRTCNFEATLQRAIFASTFTTRRRLASFKRIFDLILQRFSDPPENVKNFNFFAAFENQDNVLFREDTVSFDLYPTFMNNVNEFVFRRLHCDDVEGPHNPSELE